jgi:sn-glycerol 3-phosphate transport system substrate-binding protein
MVQVYDAGAAIMVNQVKNGVVYPFEDMAAKYGVAFNKDDYIPGIRNFYADSNGKMIGIPFNSSTCLLYANMDVLAAAGIESVPKTYEEFEAVAQQIKDAGYIPLLQSHSPWIWTENFFSRHNLLMTDGNNGYDAVPTKTLFADTPEFIQHWTKVKEWKDKGWYEYKGRAWGDNQAPFIAGEAAFWIGSAASFSGMKGIVPNFTVNHVPYWSGITGGKEYPTFIGGAANWILSGKSDEEYKALMNLAEFMTTPEIQLYYHNLSGYAAVTYSATKLANDIGFYDLSPYHKAVGEQLSLTGSTIPGGYQAGNWPQIREVIYDNVAKMLNGEISVEDGWKATDAGAAKLLAQFAKTL